MPSSNTRPPDVTDEQFAAALAEFGKIVGDEYVVTSELDLARYADPYPVMDEGTFEPSAAVLPASTEQVQAVVRVANECQVPLSPVSTGRNNAYGGGAPRLSGAVVLDLGRMDRILDVNEALGYALVEPGVSYFDLYQYLRAGGYRLWLDTADLGWGSVVGNALERGVGFTPYGDHFGAQCGMEVVLPDGEVVRTGMGAVRGGNTWQVFKYGYGPYVDGLFTQSNYGVVTKMGIWLMPEPPGYQAFMISIPREEDLGPFIEVLRPLRINQTIQNNCTIRHVLFDAATIRPKRSFYDGSGRVPDSVIAEVQNELDLGFWNFYGALYGSPSVIQANLAAVQDAFSQIPGVRFFRPEDRPGEKGVVLRSREKVMRGEPNLNELQLLEWIPNGGHVDFSPVLPMTGTDATRQYTMIRDRCHEYGLNYFSSFIVGSREVRHIATFVFDTASGEARRNVLAMCRQLVKDTRDAGYGEYRTHLALMDDVAAAYDWNGNAQLRLNECIKDALDPNGVLAPGKQGIWPKRLRGRDL